MFHFDVAPDQSFSNIHNAWKDSSALKVWSNYFHI